MLLSTGEEDKGGLDYGGLGGMEWNENWIATAFQRKMDRAGILVQQVMYGGMGAWIVVQQVKYGETRV